MPSSGGGVGTPVSPPDVVSTIYDQQEELILTPNCAVSLSRYTKLIGYDEVSFWGVLAENSFVRGCDPIWSENERMSLQNALGEAQQEIEQVIGYPLCPTYISGTYDDNPRWFDQQKYCSSRIITRYPRIIAVGSLAVTVIESDSIIDYDIAVGLGIIGPLSTSALSTDEIKVYYPDSDREITPSKITISGGSVTIEVPKYRMVKQEFLNNPSGDVLYEMLGFFLAEVDVKRVYIDTSDQATLVRPNCRNGSCVNGCYECTQTACMYIRDPFLGIIDINPATWDSDLLEWKTNFICRNDYSIVRLNYLAGVRRLDLQAEMAVVRLAHVKMGRPPCQCDRTREMWSRDYDVTGAVTRERVNCPFGLSTGAWTAYRWALTFASKRASIF
jgi:hypothetical protein